jgi:hypothetical protein
MQSITLIINKRKWVPQVDSVLVYLVAHAERASGHFGSGADLAVCGVVAFAHKLVHVHASWWRHPQSGWQLALEFAQYFASS